MPTLLIHTILLQNPKLKREGNIPGLQDFTLAEGLPMERYATIEPFDFALFVLFEAHVE